MEPAYIYRANCTRVIDADTLVLTIDLGFRVSVSIEARLHGIDAPESNTPEGKLATTFVAGMILGQPVIVQSYKDQRSFARWVCDIEIPGPDGGNLAELLRAAGFEKKPAPK